MKTETDEYLTIEKTTAGLFKDKGSRFLSFAFPATNEQEIKSIVENLKKEYYDARHVCYAYRIGAEKLQFRANDDGEPSGTAGKPILGQIISRDLTNVLIVVVRYFGGTLLGTSGLINAYREAASDSLTKALIISKFVYTDLKIEFDYLQMNDVMKIIKEFDLATKNQAFEIKCCMNLQIRNKNVIEVQNKLLKIDNLKIAL